MQRNLHAGCIRCSNDVVIKLPEIRAHVQVVRQLRQMCGNRVAFRIHLIDFITEVAGMQRIRLVHEA